MTASEAAARASGRRAGLPRCGRRAGRASPVMEDGVRRRRRPLTPNPDIRPLAPTPRCRGGYRISGCHPCRVVRRLRRAQDGGGVEEHPRGRCVRRPALRRDRHRYGGGRRHARPPARSVRQAGAAARTRGLPAAGAGQLGLHRGVRHGQVPRAGVLVRPARRRVPARGQLLRRRQHQVLRRGAVPAAARRTSASSATTAASPRPGRSTTTTSSRTTPRPSTSTSCTAGTARTRPRARPARSTAIRRCSTSRGSSSSATTWRSRGCTRSTCRSACDLTQDDARRGPPATACASAATGSTASPACWAPSPTPR